MAPKVLIILKARWPRAFLRLQLRDRGYDAVAAPDAVAAQVFANAPTAPIRLIIVEEGVLGSVHEQEALDRIRAAHPGAEAMLIGDGGESHPPGKWAMTLAGQEPAEILRIARELVPTSDGTAPSLGAKDQPPRTS